MATVANDSVGEKLRFENGRQAWFSYARMYHPLSTPLSSLKGERRHLHTSIPNTKKFQLVCAALLDYTVATILRHLSPHASVFERTLLSCRLAQEQSENLKRVSGYFYRGISASHLSDPPMRLFPVSSPEIRRGGALDIPKVLRMRGPFDRWEHPELRTMLFVDRTISDR